MALRGNASHDHGASGSGIASVMTGMSAANLPDRAATTCGSVTVCGDRMTMQTRADAKPATSCVGITIQPACSSALRIPAAARAADRGVTTIGEG
jgi:hypothetical protein